MYMEKVLPNERFDILFRKNGEWVENVIDQ